MKERINIKFNCIDKFSKHKSTSFPLVYKKIKMNNKHLFNMIFTSKILKVLIYY